MATFQALSLALIVDSPTFPEPLEQANSSSEDEIDGGDKHIRRCGEPDPIHVRVFLHVANQQKMRRVTTTAATEDGNILEALTFQESFHLNPDDSKFTIFKLCEDGKRQIVLLGISGSGKFVSWTTATRAGKTELDVTVKDTTASSASQDIAFQWIMTRDKPDSNRPRYTFSPQFSHAFVLCCDTDSALSRHDNEDKNRRLGLVHSANMSSTMAKSYELFDH